MPEPLKRKREDGTRYERPPEIEECLEKLDGIEPLERIRQFETLTMLQIKSYLFFGFFASMQPWV